MSQASTAPNRFERKRLRNRRALLDAAIELFQARGVRATKLEDICEHADVSARTFFNHFETREHLYRAIARQRLEEIAARIDASAADPRAFAERLRALTAEIASYLTARPAYRELVAEMLALRAAGGDDDWRLLGDALVRYVEAGVDRGEVTERHAPTVLADLLSGALTTALARWCMDDGYDLERGLADATAALLDLFAPRRPSA